MSATLVRSGKFDTTFNNQHTSTPATASADWQFINVSGGSTVKNTEYSKAIRSNAMRRYRKKQRDQLDQLCQVSVSSSSPKSDLPSSSRKASALLKYGNYSLVETKTYKAFKTVIGKHQGQIERQKASIKAQSKCIEMKPSALVSSEKSRQLEGELGRAKFSSSLFWKNGRSLPVRYGLSSLTWEWQRRSFWHVSCEVWSSER